MLYSTRTTMPLLVPAVAAAQKWSKTDSGTVLSSFFWGYTLTQVMGGYFSDRFGGQRVILFAALGWSIITFLMPTIIWSAASVKSYTIPIIVTIRILNGALQGVHFPSMISLTSQVKYCNKPYLSVLYIFSDFRTYVKMSAAASLACSPLGRQWARF